MSRPHAKNAAVGVTLFPFLAVLICTMGALIVLLVMLVGNAREQADDATRKHHEQAAAQAERARALAQQRDDHRWRHDVLEQQRREELRKLGDQRLELSHLEDHIRRLQERATTLQAQLRDLERLRENHQRATADGDAELEEARRELEQARAELAAAREEASQQRKSYALVVYEGSLGTRRRPIYIECGERGVVLQPEGVVLAPGDFREPLGPGNPLDAALLAVREYRARGGVAQAGEPYPLLVVRPDGAYAYAKARAAIVSWEDEFGYELVENELPLTYPPPDPMLAQLLRQTVAQARQRQASLLAAAPRRFRATPGFRGDDLPPSAWLDAELDEPDGWGSSEGDAGGDDKDLVGGEARLGGEPGRSANDPATDAAARDSATRAAENAGALARRFQPTPPGETSGAEQAAAPGAANDGAGNTPASARTKQRGHPGMGPEGDATPLAATRGANWALRSDTRGATPYRVQIPVQCLADRLVLPPRRDTGQPPVVIAMPQATRATVDNFVEAVQARLASWGDAPPGGYWKPVLQIEVGDTGEQRFADLSTLLARSGIEVERKGIRAALRD